MKWHLMNTDRHCLCQEQPEKRQVGTQRQWGHKDQGERNLQEGGTDHDVMLQKGQIGYRHKRSDFSAGKCLGTL